MAATKGEALTADAKADLERQLSDAKARAYDALALRDHAGQQLQEANREVARIIGLMEGGKA